MTFLFVIPLVPATQSSQASLQKIAGASNWWITPPPASSPHTIPADSADHPGQVLARLQLVDLAGSECSGEQEPERSALGCVPASAKGNTVE